MKKQHVEGWSPPCFLTFCLEYLRSLSYTIHFIINLQKYIFFRSIFIFQRFFFIFIWLSKAYCNSTSYTLFFRKSYKNGRFFFHGRVKKAFWNGIVSGEFGRKSEKRGWDMNKGAENVDNIAARIVRLETFCKILIFSVLSISLWECDIWRRIVVECSVFDSGGDVAINYDEAMRRWITMKRWGGRWRVWGSVWPVKASGTRKDGGDRKSGLFHARAKWPNGMEVGVS